MGKYGTVLSQLDKLPFRRDLQMTVVVMFQATSDDG
jgi:hypothetical protein